MPKKKKGNGDDEDEQPVVNNKQMGITMINFSWLEERTRKWVQADRYVQKNDREPQRKRRRRPS